MATDLRTDPPAAAAPVPSRGGRERRYSSPRLVCWGSLERLTGLVNNPPVQNDIFTGLSGQGV
jgi:hypothetical protein